MTAGAGQCRPSSSSAGTRLTACCQQLLYERPCQQSALRDPRLGLPLDVDKMVYDMLRGQSSAGPAAVQGCEVSCFDFGELLLPSAQRRGGHDDDGEGGAGEAWVEPELAVHSRAGLVVRVPEGLVAKLALLNGESMCGSAERRAPRG